MIVTPRCSVIIPTTCEAKREKALVRAIESIQSQKHVSVDLIVVVNGNRYEARLLEELKSNETLRCIYQQEGSQAAAQRYGRSLVASEYFSFLDDDDEYLPDALKIRIDAMQNNPESDMVVTNGYNCFDGKDEIRVIKMDAAKSNPLIALLSENWLASCGALFRSATIPIDFFDGKTRYFEWTLLAFKLAISKRLSFIDVPTYRVFNSPQSLSKTLEYRHAAVDVLKAMLSYDVSHEVRSKLKSKLASTYHDLSAFYLDQGNKRKAREYHFHSLISKDFYKYLAYTRKVI